MRTGVVLAGGHGRRFGGLKALAQLNGRPLITHVLDGLSPLVDELIVVLKKVDAKVREVLKGYDVRLCEDDISAQAPLIGLMTGFKSSSFEYAAVLPCDSPLVDRRVVERLFKEAIGFDAAVPMWSNGYMEPLHSVYRVDPCLEASEAAVKEGFLSVRSMIARLRKVNYVKAEGLGNPRHFINLNTVEDLRAVNGLSEANVFNFV